MNINEVSQILNVGINTLRLWEEHFQLDIKRDSKGRRYYTQEDLKVLQTIKALRDNDNGLNTISRKLQEEFHEKVEDEPELEEIIEDDMEELEEKQVIAYFDDKLDKVVELTEKYSEVCYELGKIQAELESTENKYKMLQEISEKDISVLKKEIEKKELENTELIKKIEFLQSELEKERGKTWVKKLMGN